MAVSVETQTSELAARIEQYRKLAQSGNGRNEVEEKIRKNLHSLIPLATALGDKFDGKNDGSDAGIFEKRNHGKLRLKTQPVEKPVSEDEPDDNSDEKPWYKRKKDPREGNYFSKKQRTENEIALFQMYLAGYAGLAFMIFAVFGRV